MAKRVSAGKVDELGWWDLCAPMTAEELDDLQGELGWTNSELARRLRMTTSGVTRWRQGGTISGPACVALRLYLERHIRHELLG